MEGPMVRPKSEVERKLFGIRIYPPVMKAMKVLAAKKDMPVNHAFEEALKEYLEKYGEKIEIK
jgi:predicted HicB family RNase H-like nuclease